MRNLTHAMYLNFCEVSLRLYVQKLNMIVTVIQALRVALNPLQTRSQKAMTQHHHPLRYLKWYLEAARVKLWLDITLVGVRGTLLVSYLEPSNL